MENQLNAFVTYITSHTIEIAGLIIAYLSLIVPIRQYLGQKKIEEKDKRFHNYHTLVGDLVGSNENSVMLDKQIAVIFELRNYPEYFEVSERILKGLLDSWSNSPKLKRAVNEIEITLLFISNN